MLVIHLVGLMGTYEEDEEISLSIASIFMYISLFDEELF
jgi:hypothetical protein